MAELPIGQPFSRVYLRPDRPLPDSPRFRKRLSAFFYAEVYRTNSHIPNYLELEYGISVPMGATSYVWSRFFESYPLDIILDSITGIYACCLEQRLGTVAKLWSDFVTRVFSEEGLRYRLDVAAGVHFREDEDFESSRAATIAGLGGARYAEALAAYERGVEALDGAEPDTASAVRGVFEAVESLFKLMFDKAKRLGSAEIERLLRPTIPARYPGRAADLANMRVTSFARWADGVQSWRHAEGVEQPSPLPLELALEVISSGSATMRWLISLDQADRGNS
jgi:hypothetical protein